MPHLCPRCQQATAEPAALCPSCRSIKATNRVILTVVIVLGLMAVGSVVGSLVMRMDLTGG